MFHPYSRRIAAAIIALGFMTQAQTSFANTTMGLADAAPIQQSPTTAEAAPKTRVALDLDALMLESKAKTWEARQWVKSKAGEHNFRGIIDEIEIATDRLQDNVTPYGTSLKTSIKANMPGKSFLQNSDRRYSVYGLLLIMSFATVLLLMSLANPSSRLGGRH